MGGDVSPLGYSPEPSDMKTQTIEFHLYARSEIWDRDQPAIATSISHGESRVQRSRYQGVCEK